ncbi:probable pre-mRNA-splicing factor ATP-dependent RNA helicase DEAH4 isoform X2 [Cryptomeria japonica]|uniref:probable pre-mRNA-splicing factor ATP-dependent RNA helicase DEAH4 isoform X2 n=1 Tax=Cryptomeria japonica TaxID=3369 RepID=UPI0027DA0211|nr:probable pre-mRNA-splicing factor ATP-dependent RNA helicase DEAH4 isoform X2 [Cryptomeria japonica]
MEKIQLPINEYENEILKAVTHNSIVVIIGETGSGKTTQLSQIMHRHGFTKSGRVGITQPRRVAAVSVSRRVASEMGVRIGEEVGYSIRFEDRTSDRTCIKYLTDGCLLRECLSDPELRQYAVIILDEAHERSLNTDILLGLMKKLVRRRSQDLKDDIDKTVSKLEERIRSLDEGSCMDAIILPLHGSLPPEMQVRVFMQVPPNCRRIIVATNIAETSLTVDGVVYVIDPGFVKQRQYNPGTGMYSLDVVQISRVQADQRAGRAGRTRPGKCYRLYPFSVYEHELLEATIPEIQRSSLASAVLHLKSLDLPDIDVLKFDFLDQPSRESLEDALKQLYLIDAIDDDGLITKIGRQMAELPLEPSLARALIAANDLECLSQCLTVAAMLSCENVFTPTSSKGASKKRERVDLNLPDGSGMGDHIQLLEIYEEWHQNHYDVEWCKNHGLQVRSMMFAKDVRQQLSSLMYKITKESLDVMTKESFREKRIMIRKLRKALCVGFANRLAQRMERHNGYRTLCYKAQLVQVHPTACPLEVDDDGLYPEYVLYNELLVTSRPYIRNLCSVEASWVKPIWAKLQHFDIGKLSGRALSTEELNIPTQEVTNCSATVTPKLSENRENIIQSARERFLARKQLKVKK